MPLSEVNGIQIYYEEVGQGFPLVFVHGGWSDLTAWSEQVPVFAQKCRVITYDRRGCGNSTKVLEDAHSPELWVEDLYQLLRKLGIQQTYLCGSSYGGMTVLEFLMKHQDMVRGAVLVSTTGQGFVSSQSPFVPFPDRTKDLPNIKVPCLVIQGAEDTGFPPSHGEILRDGISNSQLVVVSGAGHSVHREKPQEFNAVVLGYLEKVESGVVRSG